MQVEALKVVRINSIFESSTNTLCHQNENERGKRVTLANTSRELKGWRGGAIDQNGK
jgi:hypothetical protein